MIALRCLPMIFLAQLSWFLRVMIHKKLISYVRGVAGGFLLAPAMIKDRAKLNPYWRASWRQLWEAILKSESLARREHSSSATDRKSVFLKWYFRLF